MGSGVTSLRSTADFQARFHRSNLRLAWPASVQRLLFAQGFEQLDVEQMGHRGAAESARNGELHGKVFCLCPGVEEVEATQSTGGLTVIAEISADVLESC